MKVSDDKKFLCRKNAEGEARSPEMVKGWLTGWSSLLTSEIVQRHLSVGSVYKRSGIVEWNSSGALEEQDLNLPKRKREKVREKEKRKGRREIFIQIAMRTGS